MQITGPALKLLEKYPTQLGLAGDDQRNCQNALKMLARKPSVILSKISQVEFFLHVCVC